MMCILKTSAVAVFLLAIVPSGCAQGKTTPTAPPSPPVAAVSAAPPGARIVPPPQGYRFPTGQTYFYGVEWHRLSAGTANVTLESVGAEQHVTAVGASAGMVNVFFKVHDRFESFFDPHTFCSLRVLKHTEEGPRRRDAELRFDYTKQRAILDEKNLKTNESKRVGNDIPACVTDLISGFYYLASLPLLPGSSYIFPINDGGKTAEVTANVEAPEQLKVPAGTFQTIRVKAEPTSGPQKGKVQVYVWFTDDPNHTPVQMRSGLGWGTLVFRLQKMEK